MYYRVFYSRSIQSVKNELKFWFEVKSIFKLAPSLVVATEAAEISTLGHLKIFSREDAVAQKLISKQICVLKEFQIT